MVSLPLYYKALVCSLCSSKALVLAMCSEHNAVSVLIKSSTCIWANLSLFVFCFVFSFFINLCIYKYYIVHSFI